MKSALQETITVVKGKIATASSKQLHTIHATLEDAINQGRFRADKTIQNQAMRARDLIRDELNARVSVRLAS